ncbi:MAG: YggW family oxidoreductase, partial [Reinekea sp.]|nr:YggW family oxidoreductase [Reinekea sp.]
VAKADRPFDYFINTLRIREPVSLIHFQAATGVPVNEIEPVLNELQNKGWIKRRDDIFHTTDTGFLYLNDLLSYWLSES